MAAITPRMISHQILKRPWDAKIPTVKSKESPGKKNPSKKPDSAKMVIKIPTYPKIKKPRKYFVVIERP